MARGAKPANILSDIDALKRIQNRLGLKQPWGKRLTSEQARTLGSEYRELVGSYLPEDDDVLDQMKFMKSAMAGDLKYIVHRYLRPKEVPLVWDALFGTPAKWTGKLVQIFVRASRNVNEDNDDKDIKNATLEALVKDSAQELGPLVDTENQTQIRYAWIVRNYDDADTGEDDDEYVLKYYIMSPKDLAKTYVCKNVEEKGQQVVDTITATYDAGESLTYVRATCHVMVPSKVDEYYWSSLSPTAKEFYPRGRNPHARPFKPRSV